jgi:hypothetical protein
MKQHKFDFWKAIVVGMLSIVFLSAMIRDIDTMTITGWIFCLFLLGIFNAGVWAAFFKARDKYNFEEWLNKEIGELEWGK